MLTWLRWKMNLLSPVELIRYAYYRYAKQNNEDMECIQELKAMELRERAFLAKIYQLDTMAERAKAMNRDYCRRMKNENSH
jgi:hypothetical protein